MFCCVNPLLWSRNIYLLFYVIRSHKDCSRLIAWWMVVNFFPRDLFVIIKKELDLILPTYWRWDLEVRGGTQNPRDISQGLLGVFGDSSWGLLGVLGDSSRGPLRVLGATSQSLLRVLGSSSESTQSHSRSKFSKFLSGVAQISRNRFLPGFESRDQFRLQGP